MVSLSPQQRKFFTRHGRQGGRVRSLSLTAFQRSAIASRAARARWAAKSGFPSSSGGKKSIRLDKVRWDDPVYLEEILSEGSLEDWKKIYHIIADHPFGPVADALSKVLDAAHVYGVTPLWKDLLNSVRNAAPL